MPTYSHSKLETFENCPMRYKLQYIDKVEVEEFESVEAFLGGWSTKPWRGSTRTCR